MKFGTHRPQVNSGAVQFSFCLKINRSKRKCIKLTNLSTDWDQSKHARFENANHLKQPAPALPNPHLLFFTDTYIQYMAIKEVKEEEFSFVFVGVFM